ncbi:MAG: hypothetical protein ACM3VZ_11515 [Acidobacteriota bacterium]
MDLQERINAAGAFAVANGRATGPRTWRRQMAEAAGCSYQNIAQAAKGEQETMDVDYLRKIAKWAGVSEDWMISDIGQMVESGKDYREDKGSLSDSPPLTVVPYSGTKLVRAPVVEWARLGTDLLKESSLVEATEFIDMPSGGSPLCKWFIVEEGAPAFRIRKGHRVALDPDLSGHEFVNEDIYLFKDLDGVMFLAEYRKVAGGGFEAITASGRTLDKERHGLEVIAIQRGMWK